MIKKTATFLFIAAFAMGLLIGGETRSLFFWPSAALFGASAVCSLVTFTRSSRFTPVYWLQIMFWLGLAYAIGRALVSPVPFLAREDIVLLLTAGIVYARMTRAGDHPKQRILLFYVILIVAVAQITVTFIQRGDPGWHPISWMRQPNYLDRVSGLFSNPNHLGSFLVAAELLLLGILCFGRGSETKRVAMGFGAVLLGFGVLFTQSRGALVACAGGLFVFVIISLWLVWKMYRERAVRIVTIASVLGVLSIAAVSTALNDLSLNRYARGAKELEDVRVQIWETASAQAADYPWFGSGSRTFIELENKYRSSGFNATLGNAEYAHSEFLQVLAEYGRVGLLIVLAILLAHVMTGSRFLLWFVRDKYESSGTRQSSSLGLAVGSLSALTALLVQAAVEFQLHTPAMILVLAYLLGNLAAPGFESRREGHEPFHFWAKGLGMQGGIAGMFLLFLFGTKALADWNIFKGSELMPNHNVKTEEIRENHHSLAARYDPEHYLAWNAVGDSHVALSTFTKGAEKVEHLKAAISAYEHGVAVNPWNRQALRTLIDLQFLNRQHEGTESKLKQLEKTAPNDSLTWWTVAVARYRQGRFAEAEKACLRLREVNLVSINDLQFFWLYSTILHAAAKAQGLEQSPGMPLPHEFQKQQ